MGSVVTVWWVFVVNAPLISDAGTSPLNAHHLHDTMVLP